MRTSITKLSQCIERNYRTYSEGSTKTAKVNLEKGKTYRVSAKGCPRTRTVEISVSKAFKTIAFDVGKPVSICFVAPESGTYTYKVKAVSLYSGYSVGKIDDCLYESYGCH